MGIVFFCNSCGARFEVDARMAGKKGRCKKCGQFMVIPRSEEIASMAAIPALAGVAEGDERGPVVKGNATPSPNWLATDLSKALLAPITLDRIPVSRVRPSKPSPLDDAEDSKPYMLTKPVNEDRGAVKAQGNTLAAVWRHQVGGVIKVFRKINQTAYLISVPFLMVLIVGTVIGHRPTAVLGATLVVLLNIARFVSGFINVAMVPLRDGMDMEKLKKPLQRVLEPVVTIGLVVVAFTFVPWIAQGSTQGNITDRLEETAVDLKAEIKQEVRGLIKDARQLDVEKLGEKAQQKLNSLGGSAGSDANRTPDNGITIPSPESAINHVIQGVGQRSQDIINQAQPRN
jgi:hypothetical protein